MDSKVQSICLWSGYAFFVLYLVGMVGVAGFIPPPQPSWSAEETSAFFSDNQTRILLGMSLCAFAAALYVPWGVSIFGEMVRMENTRIPLLSVAQVVSAGVGAAFLALSPLLWLALAYRDSYSSESVGILNDFAWIAWIVSWPFFFVQAGALGLCILMHPTATIPRWVGYFSIWFGLSMFPASLIVFFDQGPFAWNGVIGIYLPLTMFAIWYQVVTFYLRKGIRNRAAIAERDAVSDSRVTVPA